MRAEGGKENLGIMGGMKAIAENLKTDYVLHLENDMPLIVNFEEAQKQLTAAMENLQSGNAQCYRMDEFHPQIGGERAVLEKYLRYHPAPKLGERDTIARRLRRLLRPGKARRLAGMAVYGGEAARFPKLIAQTKHGHWAVRTTAMNWSNRAPLYPRKWFLEKIISYAEAHPSPHKRNNSKPDLERELNHRRWWRKQGWRIGICNNGLFEHQRLDRPPHDEKGKRENKNARDKNRAADDGD